MVISTKSAAESHAAHLCKRRETEPHLVVRRSCHWHRLPHHPGHPLALSLSRFRFVQQRVGAALLNGSRQAKATGSTLTAEGCLPRGYLSLYLLLWLAKSGAACVRTREIAVGARQIVDKYVYSNVIICSAAPHRLALRLLRLHHTQHSEQLAAERERARKEKGRRTGGSQCWGDVQKAFWVVHNTTMRNQTAGESSCRMGRRGGGRVGTWLKVAAVGLSLLAFFTAGAVASDRPTGVSERRRCRAFCGLAVVCRLQFVAGRSCIRSV